MWLWFINFPKDFRVHINIAVDNISKNISINKDLAFNSASENISLPNIIPAANPLDINIISTFLMLFNGRDILKSKSKPVYPVKITEIVKNSSILNLKIFVANMTDKMLSTTLIAAGIDLLIIFIKKLPFILSLLGSKAKMKDGIPIVNILINVICIGING